MSIEDDVKFCLSQLSMPMEISQLSPDQGRPANELLATSYHPEISEKDAIFIDNIELCHPDLLTKMYRQLALNLSELFHSNQLASDYAHGMALLKLSLNEAGIRERLNRTVIQFLGYYNHFGWRENLSDKSVITNEIIQLHLLLNNRFYTPNIDKINQLTWYSHKITYHPATRSHICLPAIDRFTLTIYKPTFTLFFYTMNQLFEMFSQVDKFIHLHINDLKLCDENTSHYDYMVCYQAQKHLLDEKIAELVSLKKWAIPFVCSRQTASINVLIDFFESKLEKLMVDLINNQHQFLQSLINSKTLVLMDIKCLLIIEQTDVKGFDHNKLSHILLEKLQWELLNFYLNPAFASRDSTREMIQYLIDPASPVVLSREPYKRLIQWAKRASQAYDHLNWLDDLDDMLEQAWDIMPTAMANYSHDQLERGSDCSKDFFRMKSHDEFAILQNNIDANQFDLSYITNHHMMDKLLRYTKLSTTYYHRYLAWLNTSQVIEACYHNGLSPNTLSKWFLSDQDYNDWSVNWVKDTLAAGRDDICVESIAAMQDNPLKTQLSYQICCHMIEGIYANSSDVVNTTWITLLANLLNSNQMSQDLLDRLPSDESNQVMSDNAIVQMSELIKIFDNHSIKSDQLELLRERIRYQQQIQHLSQRITSFIHSMPEAFQALDLTGVVDQYNLLENQLAGSADCIQEQLSQQFHEMLATAIKQWVEAHQFNSDFCYGIEKISRIMIPWLDSKFGPDYETTRHIKILQCNKTTWLVEACRLSQCHHVKDMYSQLIEQYHKSSFKSCMRSANLFMQSNTINTVPNMEINL